MDPATQAAQAAIGASPSDDLLALIDTVLDAAIAALANRPFFHYGLVIAKSALHAFWPTIMPSAKAAVAAKGMTYAKAA